MAKFIDSNINRINYPIGDRRRLPGAENVAVTYCIHKPNYYTEAIKEIRKNFENQFQITPDGITMPASANTEIEYDGTYAFLNSVIGFLHMMNSISYSIHGEKSKSEEENKIACQYIKSKTGISSSSAFHKIYHSFGFYILEDALRKQKISCPDWKEDNGLSAKITINTSKNL
ncbi:hypothetical protein [Pararhodospirillum photometricum]|uniref:hypothetical protein n=1 Tax=Pararhodospirillum photometricum TaxID=1084 RepID=UPI00138ACB34|nr:hypothetical protein [Pararhodospirillum photometricum]